MNEKFLKKFTLKNGPYKFTQKPEEDPDLELPIAKTFMDLVNIGIKERLAAPEAAYYLNKELKEIKDIPFLVAIDEIGHLYDKTPFVIVEEKKTLYPKDLIFFRHFYDLMAQGIKSGLVIAATSESHPFTRDKQFEDIPKDVHKINMTLFSQEETKALIRLYHHKGLISIENNTKEFAEYIRLLSGGQGKQLLEICTLQKVLFVL